MAGGRRRSTAGPSGPAPSISQRMNDYKVSRTYKTPSTEVIEPAYPRQTGQERFDAMTPAEQDEQFGPEKAEALRDGTISLADLVDHSELATAQDFITEKPLNAAL